MSLRANIALSSLDDAAHSKRWCSATGPGRGLLSAGGAEGAARGLERAFSMARSAARCQGAAAIARYSASCTSRALRGRTGRAMDTDAAGPGRAKPGFRTRAATLSLVGEGVAGRSAVASAAGAAILCRPTLLPERTRRVTSERRHTRRETPRSPASV